jgi:mevalonate kinase
MDGTAFGKVILFGEHAVVHGGAAIVAAIERGARAHAEPGPAEVWVGKERIAPDSDLGRAFAALCEAASSPRSIIPARVTVEFDVPVRAGLGSSAAAAVAVARALGVAEDDIARVAHAAEQVFHGSPSGVDVEAARRGGVGFYSHKGGWQPLAMPPLTLCVGLTGKPRDTRAMVAKVARNMSPAILQKIDTMVRRQEVTGALMNENHALLAQLGASSPELERLCTLARDAGAEGAKLTGAGGGGAAIALAPGREEAVLGTWRAAGFEGFCVRIPCLA